MSKTSSTKNLALALGAACGFAAVSAQASLFDATDLQSGYMVAQTDDKAAEAKCGEGKCGEGQLDKIEKMEKTEDTEKAGEAKCGEGKCGQSNES